MDYENVLVKKNYLDTCLVYNDLLWTYVFIDM